MTIRTLKNALAGCVLMVMGTHVLPAQAQQAFYEPVHPVEILDFLYDRGYSEAKRPRLVDDVYVVVATDPRGRRVRLIIDSYDGTLLERVVLRSQDRSRVAGLPEEDARSRVRIDAQEKAAKPKQPKRVASADSKAVLKAPGAKVSAKPERPKLSNAPKVAAKPEPTEVPAGPERIPSETMRPPISTKVVAPPPLRLEAAKPEMPKVESPKVEAPKVQAPKLADKPKPAPALTPAPVPAAAKEAPKKPRVIPIVPPVELDAPIPVAPKPSNTPAVPVAPLD
jgi:hypothetical protein